MIKKKDELQQILTRARAEHLRIFKEPLARGELNEFFCQVLEHKRRQWLAGALSDFQPEELQQFLDLLDEEQGQGLKDE